MGDTDADRPKRIVVRTPTLTGRTTAGGVRSVLVEVQPQQDHQEGDTNNWARGIQEAVLDVVAGEEHGKGCEHEDTANQISVTADMERCRRQCNSRK